jgi:hypothetical protein
MIPNTVDAVLSAKDLDEIQAAIATLREKLSFALALSPDERRRLAKIGLKNQTFTERALQLAKQHPELVPPGVNVDAAQRDLDLFLALTPVSTALGELQHLAEDTQTIAGSEAYAAARAAYKSAKTMGVGTGLDAALNDLSKRYRRRSIKDLEENP